MSEARERTSNIREPLAVDGVSVRFGGLLALDRVTLRVPERAVVGLIGPNGAGKTTLFNCVSGVIRPTHGRVRLFGQDATDWPVHQRAKAGIGRTFQRLELFGTLTVLENLIVAYESRHQRSGLLSDLLALPPTVETRSQAEARATEVLETLGLSDHAGTLAGDLPIGLARLVEFGRALCTQPKLLLLDEPSSGLRGRESDRLAEVLRETRESAGVSVLVVEHDMPFVLGLCDYVYVLDFGSILAEGTPAEIRNDQRVRDAYLGTETDTESDGAPARA